MDTIRPALPCCRTGKSSCAARPEAGQSHPRRAGPPDHRQAGIGHTRWATHGEPSERNAHPHASASGEIVVVHNGIVENFLELKEELTAEGVKFRSDTDTEVIAHLIELYRGNETPSV